MNGAEFNYLSPLGVQGMSQSPQMDEDDDIVDSDDSDDLIGSGPSSASFRRRRKATQRPEGADQKRQAFSKRKRGIVLKAYQLYKLCDAKVFVFMTNDKGATWAYATPGYASSLASSHLKLMRDLNFRQGGGQDIRTQRDKSVTELMHHPKMDGADVAIDNRHIHVIADREEGVMERLGPQGAQARGSYREKIQREAAEVPSRPPPQSGSLGPSPVNNASQWGRRGLASSPSNMTNPQNPAGSRGQNGMMLMRQEIPRPNGPDTLDNFEASQALVSMKDRGPDGTVPPQMRDRDLNGTQPPQMRYPQDSPGGALQAVQNQHRGPIVGTQSGRRAASGAEHAHSNVIGAVPPGSLGKRQMDFNGGSPDPGDQLEEMAFQDQQQLRRHRAVATAGAKSSPAPTSSMATLGKGSTRIPQETLLDPGSPSGGPWGTSKFHAAGREHSAPRYATTSSGFASGANTPGLYLDSGGGLVLDSYNASQMPQQSVNTSTAGGDEISSGSFFMAGNVSTMGMSFTSQGSMSQASAMEVGPQRPVEFVSQGQIAGQIITDAMGNMYRLVSEPQPQPVSQMHFPPSMYGGVNGAPMLCNTHFAAGPSHGSASGQHTMMLVMPSGDGLSHSMPVNTVGGQQLQMKSQHQQQQP